MKTKPLMHQKKVKINYQAILREKSEQVETEQFIHSGGFGQVFGVVHVVGLEVGHVPLKGFNVFDFDTVLGSNFKYLADNQQLLQEKKHII